MAKAIGLNLKQATALTRTVCAVAGARNIISDASTSLADAGVTRAIQRRDDALIFDWLFDAVSYQGVSDAAAATYIAEHGALRARQLRHMLKQQPSCPKLESYWQYTDCGYRKNKATCNGFEHFQHCPVPRHDLRNGSLNQAAYSLFLFMRDVAEGDFVRWIDGQLLHAIAAPRSTSNAQPMITALSHVHGVSNKVLSMALATFLLGGDPARQHWVEAGADLIAIDTLVHNWLHRTGILRGLDSEHVYGPGCYGNGRCADIVRRLAERIDAREFNASYPMRFARFVQHAIWRFCAQQQFNQCNGNSVDDSRRCSQRDCILHPNCAQLKLGRTLMTEPKATAG